MQGCDDDSSHFTLDKLTQNASIDGVVVVFKEVTGEEGPSSGNVSAIEVESTSPMSSGLVPRACAININLSW